MNNYNVTIKELRLARGLLLREASKKMRINRIKLYFYEAGYFRPTKKDKKKLEDFYGQEISLTGVDAYPVPDYRSYNKHVHGKKLLLKRIIFGSLSLLMLALTIVGGALFNTSIHNSEKYYGETYLALKDKVEETGSIGHDIITGLEYYQYEKIEKTSRSLILFYKTDSLLFFNECSYSGLEFDKSTGGFVRYHFTFGGDLSKNSYICTLTSGDDENKTYYSCNFLFNKEKVNEIHDFQIIVQGSQTVTEEMALDFINARVADIDTFFSLSISELLGTKKSFSEDFLSSREKGRTVNYKLQILSLIFIFTGIISFFIFIGLFTKAIIINVKPRLIDMKVSSDDKTKELPNDITNRVWIPDFVVLIIARTITILTIILMIISFISKIAIFGLPKFFSNPSFLFTLKISLLAGIFLNHFVVLGRHKKPDALFKKIILHVYLFLFIATLETATIVITNEWGYDFATLIYQYLPSNVFQVVALQYLIYLFLFFQPPFINKRKKYVRYLWHCLSFIPLGILVASYFISNSYMFIYGVKENIFVNFWFPNGFLTLSVISTLFMYTSFGLSQFFEKRYGARNSQIFFYGDRYTLIENSIWVIYIIIIGLVDLLFINNQYGYYLGLGYNYWIFLLIPIILLCKYSPNRKYTVMIDETFNELSR